MEENILGSARRYEADSGERGREVNREPNLPLHLHPSLQTHLYPTVLDTLSPHLTFRLTPLHHLNN